LAGCFFLVSHINAHSAKGEKWLDEIIVSGLRKGCCNVSWSIEVHGREQLEENEDDDGASTEDDNDASPVAPGPAVYLIFKGRRDDKSEPERISVSETIPLKFFAY